MNSRTGMDERQDVMEESFRLSKDQKWFLSRYGQDQLRLLLQVPEMEQQKYLMYRKAGIAGPIRRRTEEPGKPITPICVDI